MRNYSVRTIVAVAVSAFTFAACGDKGEASREVVLTPQATPSTPPPLADNPAPTKSSASSTGSKSTSTATKAPPAKSTPVTPPASTPPVVTPPANPPVTSGTSSAPKFGMIPVGADVALRLPEKICTNTQKVGDHITAIVTEAVMGSDGAMIPAGAEAKLEVVESTPGINDSRKVRLALRVVEIEFDGHDYDLSGADVLSPPVTNVRRQSNTDQAKKVAVGAAVGAVVGKVVGKSTKATVGGAAVGAVGGAAAAVATADYDGCIAAESRLAVKLTQGLRVRVA